MELFNYQSVGIDSISLSLSKNNSVLAVSPGGSGKTVMFSCITQRYINKSNKKVAIFVHSEKLAEQARQKLYDMFGIYSQFIGAKTTSIDPNQAVYVCMVETFDRRSENESFLKYFSGVGLYIIDECHLTNFNKIFKHFPNSKRIGFTATPLPAKIDEPLNKYYDDIIIITTPEELIELNKENPKVGVVPSICYSLGSVDRSKFSTNKNGEFNTKEVDEEFRKKKQLQNTIDGYFQRAYGKKTIIFNPEIKTSIALLDELKKLGVNCRHIDSKKNGKYGSEKWIKETYEWFSKEPDAVLLNVGMATTGFDEKSIEVVIINRSVGSIALWIQMVVRGSRPYQYPDGTWKDSFLLLDFGNNAPPQGGNMGDCNTGLDWEFMFYNPRSPSNRNGVPNIKKCPECGAANSVSAMICQGMKLIFVTDEIEPCGYIFKEKEDQYDTIPRELIRIFQTIDIKKNIEFFKDRKEFFVYYETINQICNLARKEIVGDYLDDFQIEYIYQNAIAKTTEWFKATKRRKFVGYSADVKDKVLNKLQSLGFIITIDEASRVQV